MRLLLSIFFMLAALALPAAAPATAQDTAPPEEAPIGAEAQPQVQPPAQSAAPITPAQPDKTVRFGGQDGVFRFVVVGDAMARGLSAGLERLTDLDPRFEVVNRANESSGLARTEVYDWPSAVSKILKSSNFDAIVVLLGANDRQPIRVGDVKVEFGAPEWQEAYKAKVDELMTRAADGGAKVYWLTLPVMAAGEFEADIQVIAGLQRERAVLAGATLVDIRTPLAKPDGSFMSGDIDAKGKQRRLRTKDGIGFSRQGNDAIAALTMAAIRTGENAPELQGSGEEGTQPDAASAIPDAIAVPAATSPLFGQTGIDDVAVTFEAEALAKEVPQVAALDLSNAGKLGLRIARNSLAAHFYRTGEVIGAPFGRFDDYSVAPAP